MEYHDIAVQRVRRPIGCLKLKVTFRKRATNYRALFRKMTYKDKASYSSSPPCISQKGNEFGVPNVMTFHTCSQNDIMVQGGEDPWDALSL